MDLFTACVVSSTRGCPDGVRCPFCHPTPNGAGGRARARAARREANRAARRAVARDTAEAVRDSDD